MLWKRVLRAGGESADVSHRHAEVLVGINWGLVDADFVVEVRTSGASAEADVAEDVATVNILAGGDAKLARCP